MRRLGANCYPSPLVHTQMAEGSACWHLILHYSQKSERMLYKNRRRKKEVTAKINQELINNEVTHVYNG